MQYPHDHLFRAVFAAAAHASALARAVAPVTLAAHLDWTTFDTAPAMLLDSDLAAHHPDLLFAVRRTDREDVVLFLFEHKSQQEPFAVLQMLRYVVLVWQRHVAHARAATPVRRAPPPPTLPQIVPLLLHHDHRCWQAATTLTELLPPDDPDDPLLPTFPVLLFDLSLRSEQVLRALPLTPMGTLGLLHLAFARWMTPDEYDAALDRWADLYRAVAATSGAAALAVFHSYSLWTTDLPRQRLADRMATILDADARTQIMSTADKLIAEGRNEGRVELLLQLLRKRFGSAAEAQLPRLRAATPAQLDRWGLRLLDAKTLDEVFAAD